MNIKPNSAAICFAKAVRTILGSVFFVVWAECLFLAKLLKSICHMRIGLIKDKIKLPIVLAALVVCLFGIFGFCLGMDMSSPTANCTFGGHTEAICKMNPIGHIQEWQNMFRTLPAKDALELFSLLIVLLAAYQLRQIFFMPKITQVDVNRFYIHRPPIFNFLQEAFSGGILNPKIF